MLAKVSCPRARELSSPASTSSSSSSSSSRTRELSSSAALAIHTILFPPPPRCLQAVFQRQWGEGGRGQVYWSAGLLDYSTTGLLVCWFTRLLDYPLIHRSSEMAETEGSIKNVYTYG